MSGSEYKAQHTSPASGGIPRPLRPGSLFLDSNYLIGLFSIRDTLHHQSLKLARQIQLGNHTLRGTNYVISEVITVLAQRAGKAVALEAGKYLLTGNKIGIIQQTKYHDQRTWLLFRKTRNKNISFVDASIITTMHHEGIKLLVTFDKHLKTLAKKNKIQVIS